MMEKEKQIVSTGEPDIIEFKKNIQNWVFLDNQLKIINEKTKKIREKKQEYTQHICDYLTKNNIANKKIKIKDGEVNGELSMYEKKEYSSLTFTYLRECLEKIVNSEEQIDYIMDFIRENREITVFNDLRKT